MWDGVGCGGVLVWQGSAAVSNGTLFCGLSDVRFFFFLGAARRSNMGADLEKELRLSFMEAVNGCSKDVTLSYVVQGEGGKLTRKTRTVNVDVPPGAKAIDTCIHK